MISICQNCYSGKGLDNDVTVFDRCSKTDIYILSGCDSKSSW